MRRLVIVWLGLLTFGSSALEGSPPKLIVAIIVDQLRYDYLERFHDHFSTNGFRLFTERGSFMTYAHYNYVPTVTGPGHASYMSGGTPATHGIVGNAWYDKKTGKDVNCVEDNSVDGVGSSPRDHERVSPKNFVGSNFADELRLRFGSKVVSVSVKDRGAILPGGKKPAGAYWFHSKNGNFITSTYYRDELPDWVQSFNQRKRPADFLGQKWERLLDAKYYTMPDDAPGEDNLPDEKHPTFPHEIIAAKEGGFDRILYSPFGNQLLTEFAEAAIEGERLGQGDKPDLLCISYSSTDIVGHRFGPYSQEAQDIILRLDRQLEHLFGCIDQKAGLSNVMMVLTGDHAVAPSPEFAKEQGLDGQRLNETDFVNDLKEHLAEEFGPGRYFSSTKLFAGNLFLNEVTLRRKNLKASEVAAVAREFALSSGKFIACYSRDQILEGRATGPLGQLVTNGYNAERGGDLVLLAKPYQVPGTGKVGTTHGSPYSYDTHVPVLFFGPAFVPGRHPEPFAITDIVPTLCVALRMTEPSASVGKPMVKLLRTP